LITITVFDSIALKAYKSGQLPDALVNVEVKSFTIDGVWNSDNEEIRDFKITTLTDKVIAGTFNFSYINDGKRVYVTNGNFDIAR
jgi:hypothetical protein